MPPPPPPAFAQARHCLTAAFLSTVLRGQECQTTGTRVDKCWACAEFCLRTAMFALETATQCRVSMNVVAMAPDALRTAGLWGAHKRGFA